MDIEQIKAALQDGNPQQRMKGIRELRNCEADIASALLLNHINDEEFLVRSFVAMGLGRKQSDKAFEALLLMSEQDKDPNVRAEAANSLSFYGDISIPHLRKMYEFDSHWLVRRSIIAAIVDLKCPQELLEICQIGLAGEDEPVMESCISALGLLAGSKQSAKALQLLLAFAEDRSWRIRLQVAKSLGRYNDEKAMQRDARASARQSSDDDLPKGLRGFPHERLHQEAIAALGKLKADEDHRVVGAVLETMI